MSIDKPPTDAYTQISIPTAGTTLVAKNDKQHEIKLPNQNKSMSEALTNLVPTEQPREAKVHEIHDQYPE